MPALRFSLVVTGVIALHGFALTHAYYKTYASDNNAPSIHKSLSSQIISVSMIADSKLSRPKISRELKLEEVKSKPISDNAAPIVKSRSHKTKSVKIVTTQHSDHSGYSHAKQVPVSSQGVLSDNTISDSVHLEVPSFKGYRPVPDYPHQALSMQHHGNVIIRVLIDAQGHVIDAQIHQSSGSVWLDDAAKKAALRATFNPFVRNGIALKTSVDLPFNFVIKR